MFFFKDNREGFEPNIQNPVDEGNVEVQQKDDGFEEGECKWTDECFKEDVLYRQSVILQFLTVSKSKQTRCLPWEPHGQSQSQPQTHTSDRP